MLRLGLICSIVVSVLMVTSRVNAQPAYGVEWNNWRSHVNGDAGQLAFCYNDGLNSKTTVTIINNTGSPIDVRIESWIDGSDHNDSGVFQMTGTTLNCTVNRSLLGTASTHQIKCKVTIDPGTPGWSQLPAENKHNYTQKDPSDCQ